MLYPLSYGGALAPEVARGRASLPSGSLAGTSVRSAPPVRDGDRRAPPLGGNLRPICPVRGWAGRDAGRYGPCSHVDPRQRRRVTRGG